VPYTLYKHILFSTYCTNLITNLSHTCRSPSGNTMQYNITLNCKLNVYRNHLNRLHPNIGLFRSIFCTCRSCNWQRRAPSRSPRQLSDRTGFIFLRAVHLPFNRRYRRYIRENVAGGMSGLTQSTCLKFASPCIIIHFK